MRIEEWENFIENKEEIKKINSLIKRSWYLSRTYGVSTGGKPNLIRYTKEKLNKTKESYEIVIDIVNSYMNILLSNVTDDLEIIINLFDKECFLIEQWGKGKYKFQLRSIGLYEGICWKNKYLGTNGPGEAYFLDKPIIIEGYEHYRKDRHNLVQISIPLHDINGNFLAIIDITMPKKESIISFYRSLLMVVNGVERELRYHNFTIENNNDIERHISIEDYSSINKKFVNMIRRHGNRRVLLSSVFEQPYVGTVYYSHPERIILDANEKYKDIVQDIIKEEDIIGYSLESQSKKWVDKERGKMFWKERIKRGDGGKLGEFCIPKENKNYYYNISVEPVKRDGNIIGWLETATDVTKIKETKKQLIQRDKFITNVLESFNVPLFVYTYPDLKVKFVNKNAINILNLVFNKSFKRKDIEGKSLNEIDVDKKEKLHIFSEGLNMENFVYEDQREVNLWNGLEKTFKVFNTPLIDENGDVKLVISAGMDISKEIQLTKAKDEFFSLISHELRSPANIIIAATQLLLTDRYKDSLGLNAINHIEKIRINSYRLLRLINNFLDIQKSEAGYLDLNFENIDIISFSEEITNSIVDLTDSKDIDVIFDTEVEEKIIAIDIEKYERILLNLLSNATKFTESGGEIIVSIAEDNNYIIISVKDTGIGISKDKINKVFDKFAIIDNSLSRSSKGTGLGLSLVKLLVEKMKGKIEVESEIGEGTEFKVYLPNRKIKNLKDKNIIKSSSEMEHITNIEFSDIN